MLQPCLLSPLPGLVLWGDTNPGLAPGAKLCRASGAFERIQFYLDRISPARTGGRRGQRPRLQLIVNSRV